MDKRGFETYRRGRRGTRKQNNIILVVCRGKTEALYFKKFNLDLGKIRVKIVAAGTNPSNIVNRAIKERQKDCYRQVWCVFDKDDFLDYDDAIALAESNGIGVAYSNQAFELWFILHFKKLNHPLHRDKYKGQLGELLGREYCKTDDNLYEILKGRIKEAINNAKWGHQTHKAQGGKYSEWESCTTVYQLVEELLRWKKEAI